MNRRFPIFCIRGKATYFSAFPFRSVLEDMSDTPSKWDGKRLRRKSGFATIGKR